tara:strand:- start:847 stop:1014 length:168 start_codon:yes stop_codon:yes gene_type:complete
MNKLEKLAETRAMIIRLLAGTPDHAPISESAVNALVAEMVAVQDQIKALGGTLDA